MNAVKNGALRLHQDTRSAYWRGERIALPRLLFNLLARLKAGRGADVSYDQLRSAVWGRNFATGEGEQGYKKNIGALIYGIRKRFAEVDRDFDRLESCPDFGYRWRVGGPPRCDDGRTLGAAKARPT